MHDIVIIGAGPAGLTAAIYALRAGKNVLILEKGTFGGQVTFSPLIENYPGSAGMSGNEFADRLIDQVMSLGAEIEMETAERITDTGDKKTVVTDTGTHECKTVIIATGCKHRQTGLSDENRFVGNGVSYCAVCDGAFYRNKTVAVLGGGNSALQEALLLSDICSEVYIIQNLDNLTGEAKLREKLEKKDNVKIITGTILSGLVGKAELKAVELMKAADRTKSVLPVDGLFVAIGLEPDNKMFEDAAALNEYGYFDSDESCTTKTPGVYTAGDCRSKAIRQITTAVSDGAVAALAACRYIDE